MSNLHPGGYRGPTYYSGTIDTRLFGATVIRRSCIQALKARDHREIARTSIALGNRNFIRVPRKAADVGAHIQHEHCREKARHLRQQARKAA